jgi:hypothetical protein
MFFTGRLRCRRSHTVRDLTGPATSYPARSGAYPGHRDGPTEGVRPPGQPVGDTPTTDAPTTTAPAVDGTDDAW